MQVLPAILLVLTSTVPLFLTPQAAAASGSGAVSAAVVRRRGRIPPWLGLLQACSVLTSLGLSRFAVFDVVQVGDDVAAVVRLTMTLNSTRCKAVRRSLTESFRWGDVNKTLCFCRVGDLMIWAWFVSAAWYVVVHLVMLLFCLLLQFLLSSRPPEGLLLGSLLLAAAACLAPLVITHYSTNQVSAHVYAVVSTVLHMHLECTLFRKATCW